MPTHTIQVLDAAAEKAKAHPLPPGWPPEGPGLRPGQGIFDAVTHRMGKLGPRNCLLATASDKPGEIILHSPRCRARATFASRGDGLVIHELLPPIHTPEHAVRYPAVFKFVRTAGGPAADLLGGELLQLAGPSPLPPAALPWPPVPPAPAPPPAPPLRELRRLADEELRPTAFSLVDAAQSRLREVPAATRRRFLPRSERAEVEEIEAVRDLVEYHGVKPLTFLPDALRSLVSVSPPDDLQVDARVRLALRTAMGIPLVNLLCSPAFGTQKLHQTLAALSRLPVLEEDRAVLWLAMSSAIPPADRLAELEQIATDLGPAADDAGHAALWEGVVRMWLQEGLDGLPDDAGDLVRQLQRLLDAKHSSPAAFLTWRQLRVHVRRRPLDETILSPERVEAPASSRQRGPGVAEIMRQLATAVKIEPLVVKLKENGADEHPSPPKPPAPEPVEALTPPERPELPALPEQLAPPELPEPSAPRPLPLEALPLHAHTLLELARHRLCRGADVALAALDALRNAEARWVGAPLDPMCLLGVDEALGQALTALAAQRARLPARDEVETTAGAAEEIAASLGLALESPLPAPLVDALFRPDGLDRVRDACITAKRADASLPDWVWRGVTGGGARVAVIANDAAFHDELAACLSWAEEPSLAPLSGLQDLLDPGLGSLVERLRAANEERSAWRERETRFSGIALITSDEARARIASGWPETEPDLRTLEALLGRYKALSEALGADAREALRVHLCTSSPEAGADALDRVELLRSKASTTIVNLAFSQILEFAALMRPKTVPPPTTVMPNFSFGPPLSSKTNGGVHHGRGVYQQIESLEYGIVRFPVRLTFDEPLAARLELKFKLTRTSGDFVTPGQLASHEAPPVLDLPAGTSAHDFEIKVVLSRRFAEDMAVGKRKNLEVVVEGTGLGGKSCKTTLTWTALAMAMPELRDPIPQTVEPEEMLLCPLGVECHYDELLTHVRQGASSFFVYGPRRFGKTSLLRALDRFVDAGDVVLLRPAVASMRTLPALWNDIAAKFHERLGPARAHNSLEDGLLPFDYAYDSIREAAAERGIRAIYVLVDEAQAMFAHPRRVELAERLKERMEHAWMAVRQNGKLKRAAVLFGLIGQGHLPRLLTPNLRASLKEYERFEFSDEEILNLLRRTTGSDGLQSTKEAREHLAKLAGNLFILSKLLTEIRALCTKSQRTWFLRADVDRASAKLETAFREGEGAIWDWVRDPLNESDDRNDWRPSTAYPLALAWAGARARGEGGRTGAVALLRKLCPEAEPLEERINEVVEELRDLRVLDPRGEFKLPMLERLLTIRAESPRPLDDAERESAQRLGLRRVRRPPPERSDNDDSAAFEGGQAKIWRSTCNGRSAAVRAISLSDKTRSRARFIHEVALLRKIGEAGDQRVQVHLPRIFEMGIADDDPSQGLVIYEWIPGYPLPVESMTEPAVAEVGLQMADVLEVLERSGVVHRDIRPANVLLRVPTEEQASRAEIDVVLIDFGLARAVEHLRGGQRSIVEGVAEFIPPEVYGTSDSAAWSTAGDVYSTGVMLRKLLRQAPAADGAASSRQLRELLASMTARRPEDRPTAVGIRELFHAVVKSLESESKSTGLAELEAAVRSRVAKLPEPVRVSALDYLRSLVFIQAGMLTGVRRCAAVAAMLECAFRRVVRPQRPAPRNSPPPTYLRNARAMLSEARIEAPAWLDDQRMAAAGLLRNADHHPDDFNAIADRALGLLGSSISARDADARLLEALDHAARLVDELTHSRLVASFVGEVLRTGAPNGTPLHGQALRLA